MMLLLALLSCAPSSATPCHEMCLEFVQTCEYAAYPDVTSCEQGCEYESEQGADVEAEWECVAAAQCDQFALIECENKHGSTAK